MVFTNLDTICKRWLLEKGLPLHYYLEVLLHASTCLRELNISALKVVKSAKLPVNDYFAVDLPPDFMDDIAVTIPAGNLLQPIAKTNSLSPLRTTDSDGDFTTYNFIPDDGSSDVAGYSGTWTWFWNVNDYGEATGRFFGASPGSQNAYQIFKERRQIQLTESFTADSIVLLYISDGQSADNATQIDIQAQATISAFISWRTSPKADVKDSYEARTYYNERRHLVARLNDLTLSDVRSILYKNFTATMKN